MRVIVPERIHELADMQAPYIFYNPESKQYELKPDTPEEVVKAREEYLAWWEKVRKDNS